MSNGDMTFNWKMKQNHKMTVTMFSPDNFKQRSKPQKITTTTPQIVISQDQSPISSPQYNIPSPSNIPTSPATGIPSGDIWEFHSEFPKNSKKIPPPLSKMTSAPGNLQQFTYSGTKNQTNISEFQYQTTTSGNNQSSFLSNTHTTSSPTCRRNRVANHRKRNSDIAPPLKTQISTPSIVSLVSPISRLSITRKTKTQRPLLTKKLASTSDLMKMSSTDKHKETPKQFKPPPLLSRNSESSIPCLLNINTERGSSVLPSVQDMVSGSPSNSPYNSCNESDQEMRDVETRTGRMSIQSLIDPS